jgi:flagellar biosynthesis GTPase FlhF
VVQQLVGNITAKAESPPEHGVHVLVGPSGAGKTTMMARLARRALKTISTPEIAMISFRDHRAGAWGQLQMLCSQLGIDCYRAQDAQALATLLNELSPRRLILIDTPGVQMSDRLAECRQVCPSAQIHAVVPADVSTASLHRIMAAHNVNLQSLMISKLDESSAPWPLLQHLMTSPEPIGLSVGSESDRLEDELLPLNPSVLAELAVSQWLPAQHVPKPAMPAHSALITEFH